jgi:predicted kinase
MVSQYKAVRIRSDIERKRIKPRVDENGQLHGQPLFREPNWEEGHEGSLSTTEAYTVSSRDAVYEYLAMLSEMLLDAGYSVIVDATFLKRHHRARFLKIAKVRQRPFFILKFEAEKNQLQQRIRARQQSARDASEANETVLEQQILELEPLEPQELRYVVES